jgi:hypothetical protein
MEMHKLAFRLSTDSNSFNPFGGVANFTQLRRRAFAGWRLRFLLVMRYPNSVEPIKAATKPTPERLTVSISIL